MSTATEILVGAGILIGGLLTIGLALALVILLVMRAGWRQIQRRLADEQPADWAREACQVTQPIPMVRRRAANAPGPLYRSHPVLYRHVARKGARP